jgi:hypothetical protein
MTLLKWQALDGPLKSQCLTLVRSIPADRPEPGEPGAGRVVTPPTFNTKEAATAMQLTSLLTNNPMLTGKGVKVGGLLKHTMEVLGGQLLLQASKWQGIHIATHDYMSQSHTRRVCQQHTR